ncbi:MAG: hypothetical protein FJX54_19160 [Alphaproteobacteria bacterium]|nr:hypothetical protein [Alphaproteobacteria bacterium]
MSSRLVAAVAASLALASFDIGAARAAGADCAPDNGAQAANAGGGGVSGPSIVDGTGQGVMIELIGGTHVPGPHGPGLGGIASAPQGGSESGGSESDGRVWRP